MIVFLPPPRGRPIKHGQSAEYYERRGKHIEEMQEICVAFLAGSFFILTAPIVWFASLVLVFWVFGVGDRQFFAGIALAIVLTIGLARVTIFFVLRDMK